MPGNTNKQRTKTISIESEDLAHAYNFAAVRHAAQRRKGVAAEPYVNHLTEVAELVAMAGGRLEAVIAAVLHDTVEDTATTHQELIEKFGDHVASLVAEVTDDKSLPKAERKRLQVEHASFISPDAKLIKLADKISNVRSLAYSPPADWSRARKLKYVAWSRRVAERCAGESEWLKAQFDEASRAALRGCDQESR